MEYEQIHSKHDLCQLLNIQTRKLTGLLYYTKIETCYRQFTIPKKNGGVRTINAPVGFLKFVQRKLSRLLLKRLDEISKQNNIKQEMYWPQKVRQLIYPKDLVLYCTGLSPFSFTLIRLLL